VTPTNGPVAIEAYYEQNGLLAAAPLHPLSATSDRSSRKSKPATN